MSVMILALVPLQDGFTVPINSLQPFVRASAQIMSAKREAIPFFLNSGRTKRSMI